MKIGDKIRHKKTGQVGIVVKFLLGKTVVDFKNDKNILCNNSNLEVVEEDKQ